MRARLSVLNPAVFNLKWILISSAAALLAAAWISKGGIRLEKDDPHLSSCGERLCLNSAPFSGTLFERYPAGEVFAESHYQDGYQEGSRREYALGGSLRAEWNFHLGQKDGVQRGWFVEGPRRFESHFKNGRLDGLQTEWHLNGGVFRMQNFVDGVEQDKKILFQTGEIFTNYSIRDARIYGLDGGPLCFEPAAREGQRL